MTDVMVLQEGEEPKDARNFVLVEQIPAPRGAPRYRVAAQGVNDDGPVGIQKTVDSLDRRSHARGRVVPMGRPSQLPPGATDPGRAGT